MTASKPLPPVSRAAVVWLQAGPGATATARVRLTSDAAPNRPVIEQVEETIRLDTSGAVPRVVGVEPGLAGEFVEPRLNLSQLLGRELR